MKLILTLSTIIFVQVLFGQSFPNDWIGDYKGTLLIGSLNRPNDTIPVDFKLHEVESDSAWTYTMTYHSARFGELTKDYRIVRKQKNDPVNFIFDELNGIKMEMTLMNDCLYGMYDVMEQFFVSTIYYIDGKLMLDLMIAPKNSQQTTTAKGEDGEEDVDAVSFKPVMHQRVWLEKVK